MKYANIDFQLLIQETSITWLQSGRPPASTRPRQRPAKDSGHGQHIPEGHEQRVCNSFLHSCTHAVWPPTPHQVRSDSPALEIQSAALKLVPRTTTQKWHAVTSPAGSEKGSAASTWLFWDTWPHGTPTSTPCSGPSGHGRPHVAVLRGVPAEPCLHLVQTGKQTGERNVPVQPAVTSFHVPE